MPYHNEAWPRNPLVSASFWHSLAPPCPPPPPLPPGVSSLLSPASPPAPPPSPFVFPLFQNLSGHNLSPSELALLENGVKFVPLASDPHLDAAYAGVAETARRCRARLFFHTLEEEGRLGNKFNGPTVASSPSRSGIPRCPAMRAWSGTSALLTRCCSPTWKRRATHG